MKKPIVALLAVCLLCLAGCFSQADDTNLMNLQQVSGLLSEKGYTEEYFKEKFSGQHREDLIDLWGKPDGMLSGFWGDIWYLDAKTNQ